MVAAGGVNFLGCDDGEPSALCVRSERHASINVIEALAQLAISDERIQIRVSLNIEVLSCCLGRYRLRTARGEVAHLIIHGIALDCTGDERTVLERDVGLRSDRD